MKSGRNFLYTQRSGFFPHYLGGVQSLFYYFPRRNSQFRSSAFLDFETTIFGDIFIESYKEDEKKMDDLQFCPFNYLQFLKILFQREKNGIAIPKNKNRIITIPFPDRMRKN